MPTTIINKGHFETLTFWISSIVPFLKHNVLFREEGRTPFSGRTKWKRPLSSARQTKPPPSPPDLVRILQEVRLCFALYYTFAITNRKVSNVAIIVRFSYKNVNRKSVHISRISRLLRVIIWRSSNSYIILGYTVIFHNHSNKTMHAIFFNFKISRAMDSRNM